MTKRYATTYSNGHTVESSSPHEARNFLHLEPAQTFALSGKPVDSETFYGAVYAACDSAWHKKNLTHKRVRVLHGSSVASHVEKWVRR